MRIIRYIVIFVMFSFLIEAINTDSIEIKKYKDFQKGKIKSLQLNKNGSLSLGYVSKSIKGPDAEYYLSSYIKNDGSILIGTGHDGKLFQIKNNKIKKIAGFNRPDIYALDYYNGAIYLGTSPRGKIYKIKGNNIKVLYSPKEKFIWDLKVNKSGEIIFVTGSPAGVYKITKDGKVEKLFSPDDEHLTKLYITNDNSIVFGSGDRGILYKIINNKVEVLSETEFDEIKGIVEDEDGNIYFAAIKSEKKKRNISKSLRDLLQKKNSKNYYSSALYMVDTAGIVTQLWKSAKEYIYSIEYNRKDKSILIGTGNKGRVYKVYKNTNFSLIFENNSAQIYSIKKIKGKTYLIGNNVASVYYISDELNTKGTYLSHVFDMKVISKLGKIYWNYKGNKNEISLYARVGNSYIPDKTWTKWSPPFTKNSGENINISGYRYVQIKVVLSSTDYINSPVLTGFKFYYLQTNVKPEITDLKIYYSYKYNKMNYEGNKIKVDWKAFDLNYDKLVYNLYLKKQGNKNWVLFKKDLMISETTLEPEFIEDGYYLLKVIVDDSYSNPLNRYKKNVLISKPFVIDSTSPMIKDYNYYSNTIKFKVKDNVSNIGKVFYSYDMKTWKLIFPNDMLNDSIEEDYTLKVNKNKKIVFIKVVDERGNQKIYQKDI